jgi:hypothetical protein
VSATVVNVVASQVTKNINGILAVCSTGPTPPSSVNITGPATGYVGTSYTFTATVSPADAATPITYTWQATGQSPATHTGGGRSDTFHFTWNAAGTKTITVTATNAGGTIPGSHTIVISQPGAVTPLTSVTLTGPVTGTAFSNITFNATVSPANATTPITYTWQATGRSPVMHSGGGTSDSINFIWGITGTQYVTVTATNAGNSVADSRPITIEPSNIVFDHWIYLPVVMRQ